LGEISISDYQYILAGMFPPYRKKYTGRLWDWVWNTIHDGENGGGLPTPDTIHRGISICAQLNLLRGSYESQL